ncbi:MAG: tetratricopeptide repeat protein [Alphaproteobacteria bacterium]|nr:tetratricopeptide repeat protein [Alphaproteobacteria bacterium]
MNDPTPPSKPKNKLAIAFERARDAHLAGKLDEAISHYRDVLRLAPDHGGALNNLGVALKVQNRFAPAIACYRRALATKPERACRRHERGGRPARDGARLTAPGNGS